MTKFEAETVYKMIIYETVRRLCLQSANSRSPFITYFADNWSFLHNSKAKDSVYHYMSNKQMQAYHEMVINKLMDISGFDIDNIRKKSERIAKIIAKSISKTIEDAIDTQEYVITININALSKDALQKFKDIADYKEFFNNTAILFLIANYNAVRIALVKFRQYLKQLKISEVKYLKMISKTKKCEGDTNGSTIL